MYNTGKILKIVAPIWALFLLFGVFGGIVLWGDNFFVSLIIIVGGGLFALVSYLVLYGFGIMVEQAELSRVAEKSEYSRTKKLSKLSKDKEDQEADREFWVCKCGAKNAEHAVSCKECGNSRAGSVVSGDGGVYKKCTCGAMVKQGEKCPMCRKMVY